MDHFRKLVRDKIPQILESEGNKCDVDNIKEENILEYLYITLQDEIFNLVNTQGIDELADILELINTIGENYGYSFEDLIKRKTEKKIQYGGFEKNIILKKIY